MALIDHEGNAGALFRTSTKNLVEDAEHLIRINGSEGKIVVGVLAVVEVEPAERSKMQQPRHDLLDVCSLVVVPSIHKHLGFGTGAAGQLQSHAPVRDVG